MSLTLFSIHVEDLVRNWKTEVHQGIQMDRNCYMNVIMYADNVIILQNSEDNLQRSIHKLHELGTQ